MALSAVGLLREDKRLFISNNVQRRSRCPLSALLPTRSSPHIPLENLQPSPCPNRNRAPFSLYLSSHLYPTVPPGNLAFCWVFYFSLQLLSTLDHPCLRFLNEQNVDGALHPADFTMIWPLASIWSNSRTGPNVPSSLSLFIPT